MNSETLELEELDATLELQCEEKHGMKAEWRIIAICPNCGPGHGHYCTPHKLYIQQDDLTGLRIKHNPCGAIVAPKMRFERL